MKNYHQNSNLLSEERIQRITQALENSWSKETTDPEDAQSWSSNNKAYGQCAPTALIIQNLFGGKIIYDKTNFHLYNELPDSTQHDFSRTQFLDERSFSVYKYKTPDQILFDDRGIKTSMQARFDLLKDNVFKYIKNIK